MEQTRRILNTRETVFICNLVGLLSQKTPIFLLNSNFPGVNAKSEQQGKNFLQWPVTARGKAPRKQLATKAPRKSAPATGGVYRTLADTLF